MAMSRKEVLKRYQERHGDRIRAKQMERYYADHEASKAKSRAYRAKKSAERRAANPPKRGSDFIEHWSIPEPNSGCWLWIGAHDPKGYGRISRKTYGVTLAHRYSYISKTGDDPGDLRVCRKCDNPACVNPDHLFAGTAKDNTQDMVSKDRARGGRLRHGYNRVTKEMKAWILDGYIPKHPEFGIAAIARRHNVSEFALYKLKNSRGADYE